MQPANDLQQILRAHVATWFWVGAPSTSREAISYGPIAEPHGQEIRIYRSGPAEHPDWYYKIAKDSEQICRNRHFPSAESALEHAQEWAKLKNPRPAPRLFEWFGGLQALTVDGFTDDVDVVIVEVVPGDIVLRITDKDGNMVRNQDPRWTVPMDALTL